MKVTDTFGRTFKKLRISVTSSCNYLCEYCVPEGYSHQRKQSLPPDELAAIALKINKVTPLSSIRITGGEPLLYKGLPELVSRLKQAGIAKVSLTSNGSILATRVPALLAAGLDSVNISLDSLDENIFRALSRTGKLQDVLDSIAACQDKGLAVKLNSTVVKNSNDSQILPLLEFAMENNIAVRYIELMEMGHLKNHMPEKLFLSRDILSIISQKYKINPVKRDAGSTADYWETETGYRFGIISNISKPFCEDCDRLRLSSEGQIFGCLSVNQGFDGTRLDTEDATAFILGRALAQKQDKKFTGSDLSMRSIGG